MPTQSTVDEKIRATRMLRSIKAGDRVRGTRRAGADHQGEMGVVVDPDPFYGDGVRRVKVRWASGAEISVLPASIELKGEGG